MKTGGKAINYEQPLLARPFYLNPRNTERKIQRRILSHRILVLRGFQSNRSRNGIRRQRVVPIFLRDSRASETQARVRITPREKGETRRWESKTRDYRQSPSSLSPPRLTFLSWDDFHAHSRFARSTIPEEKWGLLVVCGIRYYFWLCLDILLVCITSLPMKWKSWRGRPSLSVTLST